MPRIYYALQLAPLSENGHTIVLLLLVRIYFVGVILIAISLRKPYFVCFNVSREQTDGENGFRTTCFNICY